LKCAKEEYEIIFVAYGHKSEGQNFGHPARRKKRDWESS
jgi:hypothetical protein